MANALTLLMPIKSGILELPALAATLLLQQKQLHAALTTIGTVHFARILILDRSNTNLRPDLRGPYVLAVITDYDGNFDDYIGDFVASVGSIFDALLKHVDGAEHLIPVSDHPTEFAKFISENDASRNAPNNQPLYQAYPQTVQEILATSFSS